MNTHSRQEKIGYKIREAQLSKVPYMLILGDKEVENNAVGVRARELPITPEKIAMRILEQEERE